MSSSLNGPKILKGAFISVPDSGGTQVLPFQYNPADLKRNLQPQMVGGEEQDRSRAVRFKGAPTQTIDATVEFDASTALDTGDATAEEYGVYAQLSALELLASPSTSIINDMHSKLASGIMEVAPMTAPTLYFVWGQSRVLPVRLNSYSITEEMFDGNLNPIRVSVAVNMRVLNYSDIDSSNHAYQRYMVYQQTMESIAAKAYGSASVTGVSPSAFS